MLDIVMERCCRLDMVRFLARSVSCPCHSVTISSYYLESLFHLFSFLFKRIIADMKEAAWGQNSRFLPAVANRQRLYVCSLLSGA